MRERSAPLAAPRALLLLLTAFCKMALSIDSQAANLREDINGLRDRILESWGELQLFSLRAESSELPLTICIAYGAGDRILGALPVALVEGAAGPMRLQVDTTVLGQQHARYLQFITLSRYRPFLFVQRGIHELLPVTDTRPCSFDARFRVTTRGMAVMEFLDQAHLAATSFPLQLNFVMHNAQGMSRMRIVFFDVRDTANGRISFDGRRNEVFAPLLLGSESRQADVRFVVPMRANFLQFFIETPSPYSFSFATFAENALRVDGREHPYRIDDVMPAQWKPQALEGELIYNIPQAAVPFFEMGIWPIQAATGEVSRVVYLPDGACCSLRLLGLRNLNALGFHRY